MAKINSIELSLPQYYVSYVVGEDGVTEIKETTKHGEMALITYYQIWKGDKLFADLHQFTLIIYDQ